jgi:hypothetical protein
VVAACALFDFALKKGLVSASPADSLAESLPLPPAEPPWDVRPEFFDMHVPASESRVHFTHIRNLRNNAGFVEREEGACRLREHKNLSENSLTIKLKPLYDAWRFESDVNKRKRKQ